MRELFKYRFSFATLFVMLNLFQHLNAQNEIIDSLLNTFKKEQHDTAKALNYNSLGNLLFSSYPDSSFVMYQRAIKLCESYLNKEGMSARITGCFQHQYAYALNSLGVHHHLSGDRVTALVMCKKALKLREKINDEIGEAFSLKEIGTIYRELGNNAAAEEYFVKSLEKSKKINDIDGIADSYNELGNTAYDKGDVVKAINYFENCLGIYEKLNKKGDLARCLNNLGAIYKKQGDLEKGLAYYTRCLKLITEENNKAGMAYSYNNIGVIMFLRNDIAGAMEYVKKAIALQEEIGDMDGLTQTFCKMGLILKKKKMNKEALEYFEKSLAISEKTGNKKNIAYSLHNIADFYLQEKMYAKALPLELRGMEISEKLGYPQEIANSAKFLYVIYKNVGNHFAALENYELYIKMRDSVNNESTRKASIKSQLKYEYEKQAAADSVAHAKESEIKNVQLQKQNTEIKAKKNQQYALFGGLVLVIIFAGFMYNRFKITQKQKYIIEEQKEVVEEQKKIVEAKQTEILDSIHYAKRIQTALIPSEKYIDKSLNKLQKRG